jgi:hypothetical protein
MKLLCNQKSAPFVADDNVFSKITFFKQFSQENEVFLLFIEKIFRMLGKYLLLFKHFRKLNLRFFQSGVYSGIDCNKVSHAVNVVGYGTLNGIPYWQVRNR